ncbi:hypothetical protein TGVAND_436850 [Toxoplasma gondii VAND]|uniref:Uncharacterized protein n=1 Tax=Toxoplasma gondii VAND TaxID=933077 RepID=A0A086Q0K3_TOXGO|nr:hypothetical protein TGVAND_436850 [Toxoplasma gondii VAND]
MQTSPLLSVPCRGSGVPPLSVLVSVSPLRDSTGPRSLLSAEPSLPPAATGLQAAEATRDEENVLSLSFARFSPRGARKASRQASRFARRHGCRAALHLNPREASPSRALFGALGSRPPARPCQGSERRGARGSGPPSPERPPEERPLGTWRELSIATHEAETATPRKPRDRSARRARHPRMRREKSEATEEVEAAPTHNLKERWRDETKKGNAKRKTTEIRRVDSRSPRQNGEGRLQLERTMVMKSHSAVRAFAD